MQLKSFEYEEIVPCEMATSTELPVPTSAVRHPCHPEVMASLASE